MAKDSSFSFEEAAVTIPSPASVQLESGGRFQARFHGNANYLRFQHEYFGDEMIAAFVSRNYAPGELLERMWDGEYAGKWLDGAIRTAVNMRDEELLATVDIFVQSLLQYQQPDGYFGIKLPTDRKLNSWEQDWDLWNQWNCLIGLLTHYELRGAESSLHAAAKLGKWITTTYGPVTEVNRDFINGRTNGGMTNVVVIGQLTRLYRHTGDEELLVFVKQVIDVFPPIRQMLRSGEPFLFHPYMLGAVLLGVVDYSRIVKDPEILARVEQVWDVLSTEHMFPTGSLGEREDLDDDPIRDVPDGQLQETCATTEWIFLTMRLYEITGDIKYIAALERTSYNALLGAQSDDGMKWCYWMPMRYSKHFLHGPTRCCFWSGPRGVARIPQMIYASQGDTLYVNFFESSLSSIQVNEGIIHISQHSSFPEEGWSRIVIKAPPSWEGAIKVRQPGWAKSFTVRLNGELATTMDQPESYHHLQLAGNRNNELEIAFDLELELDALDEAFVMRRGPEVLALDTRDNIDTWLGKEDELITLPRGIRLLPFDESKRYQWAGPLTGERRRYFVKVSDARTDDLRGVVLTPYADAGNDGAAFRTAFPKDAESSYPGNWNE